MRKHQHKQILDIIATLKEANAEIRSLLQRGEISSVLRLLGDCQEGAVQIGEFIEIVQGEGTKTVALLEEYHESLYRVGEKIETADTSFMKSLQKQIFEIESSVRSELAPDRIEVAFFPYKVSMWDSLESIWLTAEEDPGCDAYVVPIPYFDRLSDGGFGQMHYEGDLYPDDISVVDWRAYQLEERRPDVIFIHNPYDEKNLVTSVHPDYYSSRLKDFTELLCYVPYFVTPGDVEEHFVLCPGVLNADRVFLQSEKICATYLRVFKEFEKKNRCVGQFGKAEKKFIASGSPKFDRVLNTRREDCSLPDDWQTLIDDKKVVFYNTSVGPLLEGGEQYLKKLRFVLGTFRSRSDVVLWWRPHPLSETTYQSMLPHLLNEYKQIVADYRQGEWGIYDDTPDLHCAIAMSDAYLGDWSSLIALYALTDKPQLILNCEIDEEANRDLADEYSHSDVVNFAFDSEGDAEWGTSTLCNALYKISIEDGTAEYVTSFPCARNVGNLYHAPFQSGNLLIFSPNKARFWAIYNIETDAWTSIPISDSAIPRKEWHSSFGGVIDCGEFLLAFPGERGVFAKYDKRTQAFSYYSDWISEYSHLFQKADWCFFSGCCFRDGKILLTSPLNNCVFELEPEFMTFKVHSIGAKANRYCGIAPTENSYWLIKFREPGAKWQEGIVEWNINHGIVTEHNDLPFSENLNFTDRGVSAIIPVGEVLYIFPYQADCIVRYDIAADKKERLEIDFGYDFFSRKSPFYSWAENIAFPWILRKPVVMYPWNFEEIKKNPPAAEIFAHVPYDYSLMKWNVASGKYDIKKWHVHGAERRLAFSGEKARNLWVEDQLKTVNGFLSLVIENKLDMAGKISEIKWNGNENIAKHENSGVNIFRYIKDCALDR